MPDPVKVGCGENLARPQLQDVEGCRIFLRTRGPFLKSPGNLPVPISVFGDKFFLRAVKYYEIEKSWIYKVKLTKIYIFRKMPNISY